MNRKKMFLIIDFDSTLVKVESLDLLAEIVLEKHRNREEIVEQIKAITQLGMEGKIEFGESLEKRVQLFSPSKNDIKKLILQLRTNISDSILSNITFFKEHADNIYIISGGFCEFIIPIAKMLGISRTHVLANRFIWEDKNVIGFDRNNPLSKKGGKVLAVSSLHLDGKIVVIGDGYTDYEIRKNGAAELFIAYCENIKRENVVKNADKVVTSFNELIPFLK